MLCCTCLLQETCNLSSIVYAPALLFFYPNQIKQWSAMLLLATVSLSFFSALETPVSISPLHIRLEQLGGPLVLVSSEQGPLTSPTQTPRASLQRKASLQPPAHHQHLSARGKRQHGTLGLS